MQASEFSLSLVDAAIARLADHRITTPLLSAPMLDAVLGCRVLIKAECLQRTGAFKFRGALNKVLALPEDARARGVVAFSSGNHGHAVAAAAAQVGCPAVIVLPQSVPAIKLASCRWWGAQTVLYDPATQDRKAIGEQLAKERGLTLVPPFDDVDIIAGQATCGVEIAAQCAGRKITPDVVVAPCSGGGLAAGVFTALRKSYPEIETLFVEPAGSDKMAATLEQGTPQSRPVDHVTTNQSASLAVHGEVKRGSHPTEPKAPLTSDGEAPTARSEFFTLMDGLSGPTAGVLTSHLLKTLGAQSLTVTDADALAAMALAAQTLKLVLEPAGAAALAAVMTHPQRFAGKTVAVVASGGNVDAAMLIRALQQQGQGAVQDGVLTQRSNA